MTSITTVTLTMSDAEQHLFDPEDRDEHVIKAVNDFLMPIGYAPLEFKEFVSLGHNVTTHPSVISFTGRYRWFPRFEFRWFLSTLEWKAPEHVVLTLQTEGYDDIVWRAGDDKGSWKYPTLKPSMSEETDKAPVSVQEWVRINIPDYKQVIADAPTAERRIEAVEACSRLQGFIDANPDKVKTYMVPATIQSRGRPPSTSTLDPAPTTATSWIAQLKQHLGDIREEAPKAQAQELVAKAVWDNFEQTINKWFNEAFDLNFSYGESESTVVAKINAHLRDKGIDLSDRVLREYRRRILDHDRANGHDWYVDEWGNDLRYARD